jgi:hypothetical protein
MVLGFLGGAATKVTQNWDQARLDEAKTRGLILANTLP